MASIRIPTPLRPFTDGLSQIEVSGDTVGAALRDLTAQHPDLQQHLYNDGGELRPFVNVFLNSEDVRHMQGEDTAIAADAALRIVPSVAGGKDESLRAVDHSALRVNQAFIIALLLAGFIANSWLLVAVVALVMTLGTLLAVPGFKPIYRYLLKPSGIVKPNVIQDNMEPHRFSQGLGAIFTLGSTVALLAGSATLGWVLSWIVIALAALNLFGGFCVGCFVYYWLQRFHIPGFIKAPPPNTVPGMRPQG